MIRRTTRLAVLLVASVALVAFTGCGGGDNSGPVDSVDTGQVTLSVTWPAPAEIEPQLIPQLSQRIDVAIVDAATNEVLMTDTIARPDTAPWTVQKTYQGVAATDDAILTGTAYPNDTQTDGEVAQAGGSMHIVIPCNATAYPLAGAAGDPINLVLASTLAEVQVTVTPSSIPAGDTAQATATALDSDGRTVLVPGFIWSTSNANASVSPNVTPTQNGTLSSSATVTGEAVGDCDVIATESESDVAGSATITVTCVPPQITEATVTTDPDPLTTLGGTANISAVINDPRGVATATVVVTRPDSSTEQVSMTRTNGTWEATYAIPANTAASPATYSFAVVATNNDGCDAGPVSAGSVTVPPRPVISGTVSGFLVDPQQTEPWSQVVVKIQETGQWTRTGTDGTFSFAVDPNATYTVLAEKKAHSVFSPQSGSHTVNVVTSDVNGVDFTVTPTPFAFGAGRAHGFVLDGSGAPIAGVQVSANGSSDTTDNNGEFAINLAPGTYTFTPTDGYTFDPVSREADVAASSLTHVDDFIGTAN